MTQHYTAADESTNRIVRTRNLLSIYIYVYWIRSAVALRKYLILLLLYFFQTKVVYNIIYLYTIYRHIPIIRTLPRDDYIRNAEQQCYASAITRAILVLIGMIPYSSRSTCVSMCIYCIAECVYGMLGVVVYVCVWVFMYYKDQRTKLSL